MTRALADALGKPVAIRSRTPLAGGSICRTERIETSAGPFVLKSLTGAVPSALFEAEAHGLRTLESSGTSLTIPRVWAHSTTAPAFIVMEHLASGRRVGDFDQRLGAGLAALHRATATRFGFDTDNFCGLTRQINSWREHWVEFYRDQRLGPQIARASHAGLLSKSDTMQCHRLLDKLGHWVAEPAEGPALIHGDLWSGNLHVDAAGCPALIDPAVSYAHREAELGMMTLFSGFPGRVFDAYDEALPLEPGWRDRQALYQLYHLLNHLNLFGMGYRGQVMDVVRRFV